MKDTTEILLKLRKLMQKPPLSQELSLAAYIVPSDDAHQSEYICEHDERRAYVSGFDGSAGTAVVTMDKALLWTDGRYYQQALKQLDSNWSLMKDGLPTTPSVGCWLAKNIPKGSAVGVDPKLFSYRVWKPIEKELLAAGKNNKYIHVNITITNNKKIFRLFSGTRGMQSCRSCLGCRSTTFNFKAYCNVRS